jgi:hypothetical protein
VTAGFTTASLVGAGGPPALCWRRDAGWDRSVDPVLDLQAGHLAEVFHVAAVQRGTVGQRDGGDQQVGAADLLQLLVFPKPVELNSGWPIKGDDGYPLQIRLGFSQSLLGQQKPFAIFCLED